MRKVTATELQRHARDVIDQVRMSREPVVVENRGKPMAAVVPYEQLERLVRHEQKLDALFARVAAAAEANAAANGLTEEEALALVDEVRQEIWDEQHPPAD
jgi:prevent-host-death family protein